ncbi:hypothetical protein ACFFX0_16385 [Citricoccus parietis]|uniref:Uncharacterized protein n=1 Tax=Citricoccus parietis TaxID=592307 RepID=A0ABV5G181_9MICC
MAAANRSAEDGSSSAAVTAPDQSASGSAQRHQGIPAAACAASAKRSCSLKGLGSATRTSGRAAPMASVTAEKPADTTTTSASRIRATASSAHPCRTRLVGTRPDPRVAP